MDIPPLEAHSAAEAHLYLMVTPCKLCGAGRTRCSGSRSSDGEAGPLLTLNTACESCSFESDFVFSLPSGLLAEASAHGSGAARINPTPHPSQIIDVAQWLTLFRVVTEAAAAQTDKAESRRLGYEAAQCIEEALKFYEATNDLPPESAFVTERSRRQLADHPELFARSRLIGLRARLPTLTEMEKRMDSGGTQRPKQWWKLW
jgi:hypothetical protein